MYLVGPAYALKLKLDLGSIPDKRRPQWDLVTGVLRLFLSLIKVGHDGSVPVPDIRATPSFIAYVKLSLSAIYLIKEGHIGPLHLA